MDIFEMFLGREGKYSIGFGFLDFSVYISCWGFVKM